MKRPSAANTKEPSQAPSPHRIQACIGKCTCENAPTTKTATTGISPRNIAARILMATYATGRSGVSRSWRLHPSARSTATMLPPLAHAVMAP